MFKSSKLVLLNFIFVTITVQICRSELQFLSLYSAEASVAEAEYAEVMIKQIGDNLTLICEIKGDRAQRLFVWNYVPVNTSSLQRPFSIEPTGPTSSSIMKKTDLQVEDSGQYLCSSPPFSVTKFILVQEPPTVVSCARGALWCGSRCVLPTYVCDGRADCARAEDEAPPLCAASVCQRPGMLNCSSGRCISAAACCPPSPARALCLQHSCCLEHAPYRADADFQDVDFPASYEDKHAPDQYGFIQSTIYTVTACALIFMIAAVLLVSAICKMHMKRAALRSYARAAAQRHYTHHPPPRFPPCYEASRLLEQEAGRAPLAAPDTAMQTTPDPPTEENPDPAAGYGLSRLSAIFSSRYRQVPTECQDLDVEMTTVRPSSLQGSPARRPRLDDYRSPAYTDLNADYFLSAETGNCGRELNYMSPVEMYRRGLSYDRRLTLQLGRFQLSLPRFGARPDTPNVHEININDLDVVRLNGNDTYTLNGRTIRLLGGNFSSCPRPPPYSLRKASPPARAPGPPPAYLPRAAPAAPAADADADANVEMPPRYEDVNSNEEPIERVSVTLNSIRESGESLNSIDNIHSFDIIHCVDNIHPNNVHSIHNIHSIGNIHPNNTQSLDNIHYIDNIHPVANNSIHNMNCIDNLHIHGIDSADIPAIDDVNANEIVGD